MDDDWIVDEYEDLDQAWAEEPEAPAFRWVPVRSVQTVRFAELDSPVGQVAPSVQMGTP